MPFVLHRSNDLERLVTVLTEVVQQPAGPADPLRPETVVVQSRALERWLTQQLARRQGIWANPEFPFPRKVVDRFIDAALEDDGGAEGVFREERLVWAIAHHLPLCLEEEPEVFAPIRRYLELERDVATGGVDDDPWPSGRLIQLAQQLAALFDRYAVYRPDLVCAWDEQGADDWQSHLWHRLSASYGPTHLAARAVSGAAALARARTRPAGIPPRLHLFAVRTLPPLFLQLFATASRLCEVHLYHLSPSREYWGDVRPEDRDVEGLEVNPLLASLGRMGRDFQSLIEEHVPGYVAGHEDWIEAEGGGGPSCLGTLQQDVLRFRHRRPGGTPPPRRLERDDESIAVHSCFSAMREVEALRDQLLALFTAHPDLRPHEVVVMTPTIETYAPYVEAVFGVDPTDPAYLPFTVADRSPRAAHRGIDAFLALLELLPTRLTAPEVLEFLGREPVRRRFGIEQDELEVVSGWMDEAGIRWGEDEGDRVALGQPAWRQYTWRFGLDRLLVGYAAPGDGWTLFEGVLPVTRFEGDPGLLGRLAEFTDRLFDARRQVAEPAPMGVWRLRLTNLLDRFVEDDGERSWQHQRVRDTLAELSEDAERAGFEGNLSLEAVRGILAGRLDQPAPPREFLAGGITFCALVPMRSVPFRVIALLGMNDDDFPRRDHQAAFDRVADAYRPGDRSVRDDDRYQFLETVLAARDHLLISYVGQSISDGSAVPPSVVVSELLDVLGESVDVLGAEDAPGTISPDAEARQEALRQRLVVPHPLHPFDPRYFDQEDAGSAALFSYSRPHLRGARGLVGTPGQWPPFLPGPLPRPTDLDGPLELDSLVRFLTHPGQALLQERVGLWFAGQEALLEDREPVTLGSLEAYLVRQALLEQRLAAGSLDGAREVLMAGAQLALGTVGRADYAVQARAAEGEALALAPWLEEAPLEPVPLDLVVGERPLVGWLRQLHPQAQLLYRPGRLKGSFQLRGWVYHLALCALGREDLPRATVLVGYTSSGGGQVQTVRFPHLPRRRAGELLADLVALHGMGQQVALRLLPEASWSYAEKAEDEAAALKAAREAFASSRRKTGDGENSYVRLLYGGDALLEEDTAPGPDDRDHSSLSFARLALRVYGPLLSHRREGDE